MFVQDELYVLLYANSSWYLFVRLYHMFCQRLRDIRRIADARQREACGNLESSCEQSVLHSFYHRHHYHHCYDSLFLSQSYSYHQGSGYISCNDACIDLLMISDPTTKKGHSDLLCWLFRSSENTYMCIISASYWTAVTKFAS